MNKKELTKVKQNKLSHERLLELFEYNPDTGIFLNKTQRGKYPPGIEAGSSDYRGYLRVTIDWKVYLGHRLAWFYVHKKWPKDQIDHINRVKSDNRISNLREATASINMLNTPYKAEKRSGHEGIYWCPRGNFWKVNYKGEFLCNVDSIEQGISFQQQASEGIFVKPPRRRLASKISGVDGIRWNKNRDKWQIYHNKKYIGCRASLAESLLLKLESANGEHVSLRNLWDPK